MPLGHINIFFMFFFFTFLIEIIIAVGGVVENLQLTQ